MVRVSRRRGGKDGVRRQRAGQSIARGWSSRNAAECVPVQQRRQPRRVTGGTAMVTKELFCRTPELTAA